MNIELVRLSGFRNLGRITLELPPGVSVFAGDNAQGKTNLLEAVYLCSTGRSRRAKGDREMIAFGEQEAFVQTTFHNAAGYQSRVDIHLRQGRSKGAAINGIPIRTVSELFGNLMCILFTPEDLQLIKSGPGERRRFVDIELCQISKPYVYHLQTYHRILKQRNNLLRSLKKSADKSLAETLEAWDIQLVTHGKALHDMRATYVQNLGKVAARIHASLSGGRETLRISYKPHTHPDEMQATLRRTLERDIALGATSAGIHKDDIYFEVTGSDARLYASQGQQRTVALCAKLAQVELAREAKGTPPVLLLDDVLSELDEGRQKQLLAHLHGLQALITCTGVEDIVHKISSETHAKIYRVKNGDIY